MAYIILSAFIIAYITTTWFVVDMDSPSNYTNVKEYMHSKYYICNIINSGLLTGCIVVLYLNTKEWLFPLIAIIVLFINNIILSIIKKSRNK